MKIINRLKKFLESLPIPFRYLVFGILFGITFPIVGATIYSFQNQISFFEALIEGNPLLIIIDFAPFVLGGVFYLLGKAQVKVLNQELNKHSAALTRSEEMLRDAQRIANIGSWVFSVEDGAIKWSDQMFEIFPEDRKKGEPNFDRHFSTIHPEDRELWTNTVNKCLEDGVAYVMDFRTIHENGKVVWVRAHGQGVKDPFGKVVSLHGTCQDISVQKRQNLVMESVASIRKDFQNSLDNIHSHYELILSEFLKLTESEYGFIGEILKDEKGEPYLKTFAITDISWNEETKRLLQSQKRSGLEFKNLETLFGYSIKNSETVIANDAKKDSRGSGIPEGHPELRRFLGVPLFKNNEMIAMLGVANRETEYTQTLVDSLNPVFDAAIDHLESNRLAQSKQELDQELELQREFLNNTLRNLPGVFYAKDLDSRFTVVNREFENLVNLTVDEIKGKTSYDFFPKDIADDHRKNDLEIIKNKSIVEVEESAQNTEGDVRFYNSYKFPYVNSKGEVWGIGGISIDITEKKELESQNFHNSKLAAIGELAAGVGHEINNPLAIANGNVDRMFNLAKKSSRLGSDFHRAYDKYKTASWRITNIVSGLRTFARWDDEKAEVFDFVNSVDQSVALVKEIYEKEGVQLELSLPDEKVLVNGMVGRIQQALMNLITNAKDATEGKDKRLITVSVGVEDDKVILSVGDNGKGIPKENHQKIFDNFFTTKEVGKGTGMGLSLTNSIVRENNGLLSFDSELGKGTIFTITLPISNEKVVSEHSFSQSQKDKTGEFSGRRVLVVDDESDIREIISMILEGEECSVVEACNGKEALDLVKKDHFDFVFTDLKMPIMDGETFLKKVHELKLLKRPVLIAVTGGVNTDFYTKGEGELSSFIEDFILKPFKPDQVIAMLEKYGNSQLEGSGISDDSSSERDKNSA